MKVLHVIPSLSWVHGGPSHAIRTIEQASRAEGIDTVVATTDDDGLGRRLDRALGTIIAEESCSRIYFRKRFDAYCIAPSLIVWLWKNVRSFDCVHIHALFSFTSTAAAIIARVRGVSYVVRPLGVLSSYGLLQKKYWAKRISVALLESPIIEYAALIHCTSKAEADDVRAVRANARVHVRPLAIEVPSGSHLRSTALADSASTLNVLYLSRLDPKKNIESLLQAWKQVHADFPNAQLHIAGSGDATYINSLKALASSLVIDDRVQWHGHVSGDAKTAQFVNADVFVLPSFSENFGIAVAEALAYGLPCVVARGVALSEDIETHQTGIVVEPNADSIANGLTRLLGDQEMRMRCGIAAKLLVEQKFSVSALGKGLSQMYAIATGSLIPVVSAREVNPPDRAL